LERLLSPLSSWSIWASGELQALRQRRKGMTSNLAAHAKGNPMHVLVATDGTLEPDETTRFVTALAGSEGSVTVLTVVEINRNLLRDLRGLFGERTVDSSHQDAEYVGVQRLDSPVGADWPGDEEMLARYLHDQKEMRTGPLMEALAAAGAAARVEVKEGEAAPTIIAAALDLDADVVCVGSHGKGLFDGFLGSTSTKLARRSPVPILIIR
jgi:nucleotide-binding universal stress UspA family protein